MVLVVVWGKEMRDSPGVGARIYGSDCAEVQFDADQV